MKRYRNNASRPCDGSITMASGADLGAYPGSAESAASIMIGIASTHVPFSATGAVTDSPPTAVEAAPSWAEIPRGVIDGGEIVILAIKPSMWRPLFDSAAWMVGSWIIAALLTYLGRPITGLSMTTTVQIVLMGGMVGLAVPILRWIPTWYVLTNRRIIDIRGIRTPRIDSCELIEIRNTYVNVALEEKLTGLGTITFAMKKAEQRMRSWRSIYRPVDVHARIRRAIENALDQFGVA